MDVSIFALPMVLGVVGGVILVVAALTRPKRSVEPGPHCGHCGYNLTGAPSNRCPECGKLFIEAGVVMGLRGPTRRRTRLVIAAAVVPLVFVAHLLIMRVVPRQRAAVQRARTVAAQQAAQAATQKAAEEANGNAADPVEPLDTDQ